MIRRLCTLSSSTIRKAPLQQHNAKYSLSRNSKDGKGKSVGRKSKEKVFKDKAVGSEGKDLGSEVRDLWNEGKDVHIGIKGKDEGCEGKDEGSEGKAEESDFKAVGSDFKAEGSDFKAEGSDFKAVGPEGKDVKYEGKKISILQAVVNENGEKFFASLSKEQLKEKADLELMIDVWRAEERYYIPDKIFANDWKILLTSMTTLDAKLRYLKKVYVRQKRRQKQDEEYRKYVASIRRPGDDEDLNVIQNTIRMRNHLNNWNGIQSLLHGRPVVIDMGYNAVDDYETFQTAQQIERLHKLNCEHKQPCHLHFTSVYKNQVVASMLDMDRPYLADFHTESFVQLFPNERLFYLVPEGPMITEENLDKDLIFVLGGIGGTTDRRRSFAKAQWLDIPFGSLPVDKFVSRKVRSTVDIYLQIVMKIMLDKFSGDSWKAALDANLPDEKFEKYPGLDGPIPRKDARKSYRQFEKLGKILKFDKKSS